MYVCMYVCMYAKDAPIKIRDKFHTARCAIKAHIECIGMGLAACNVFTLNKAGKRSLEKQ